MGKLSRLLGITAFLGAAVGGAAYYRKKSGMKMAGDEHFEDDLDMNIQKDKKVIDVSTEGSDTESKKVTITFNKDKAKQVVENTLDEIGDAMTSAKDKIMDTIGEEHIEDAKGAASKVKGKIIDTIGEDNISKAKSKFEDMADKTKEKAGEIFTEENLDYAKDKVSDALDKTKDVIKKAADKVKSLKDTEKDAFTASAPSDSLSSDMEEEIIHSEKTSPADSDSEDTASDENDSPIPENIPEIDEEYPPKDESAAHYDFLSDEVDDL